MLRIRERGFSRAARLIDLLVRLAPTAYWRVMRRPLRAATDTRTPVA